MIRKNLQKYQQTTIFVDDKIFVTEEEQQISPYLQLKQFNHVINWFIIPDSNKWFVINFYFHNIWTKIFMVFTIELKAKCYNCNVM